jgi:hypothetical protein
MSLINCIQERNFNKEDIEKITGYLNYHIGKGIPTIEAEYLALEDYLNKVLNKELNTLKQAEEVGIAPTEVKVRTTTKEENTIATKLLDNTTINKYIEEQNGIDQNKEIRISAIISQFLTAYVDIAKNPYITRGNHNTITAGTVFMLIRAGVPIQWVNRFVGQDSIRKYVETQRIKEGMFGGKKPKSSLEETKKEYIDKLRKIIPTKKWAEFKEDLDIEIENIADLGNQIRENDIFTEESMEKFILEDNTSVDYLKAQILYLHAFEAYEDHSRLFNKTVIYSKADVNGSPSNISEIVLYEKELKYLKEHPLLINFNNKFSDTFLGTKHKNSIDIVEKIFNKEFATYNKIGKVILSDFADSFNEYTKDKKGKLARVEKALYGFIASTSPILALSSKEELDSLLKDLQGEVRAAKKKYPDNVLLNNLTSLSDGKYNFIIMNNFKNKPSEFKYDLNRAWENLNLIEPNLSRKLFKYSFLTSNFAFSSTSFFEHAPIGLIKETLDSAVLLHDSSLLNEDKIDLVLTRFKHIYYANNLSEVKAIDQGYHFDYTNDDLTEIVLKLGDNKDEYLKNGENLFKRLEEDSNIYRTVPVLGYYSNNIKVVENNKISFINNYKKKTTEKAIDKVVETSNKVIETKIAQPKKVKKEAKKASTIETLRGLKKYVVNPNDSKTYIEADEYGNPIPNGETVPRVSNLKGDINQTPTMLKGAARGTIIDDMLRDAINLLGQGKTISLQQIKDIYNNHPDKSNTEPFHELFLEDLHDIIANKIIPAIKAKGLTVYADIPTLTGMLKRDMPTKYAGTVDLIAVDPAGNWYVIDLKTSTQDRQIDYEKGGGDFDYIGKDAIQLSAYTEMLYQITGIEFTPLILPVTTDRVKGEYISASITTEEEENFTMINDQIEVADAELISESRFDIRRQLPNKSAFALRGSVQETFSSQSLDKIHGFLGAIGVGIEMKPVIKDLLGNISNGAISFSNYIEGTIDILDDIETRPEAWNSLPEEAAHFWVALLQDKALNNKLFDYVRELPNYKEEYQALLDQGYNKANVDNELIAKYISAEVARLESQPKPTGFTKFWKDLIAFIKDFIGKYITNKKEAENSPINIAAERILNSDLSDLMSVEELKQTNQYYYGSVDASDSMELTAEPFKIEEIVEFEDTDWYKNLDKRFKAKSKFMPKTIAKIKQQSSSFISNIKLTNEELEHLDRINKYHNIIPELKSYKSLRDKYTKNAIAINSPIKVDGAKKQDLEIYEEVRKAIAEESEIKTISVNDFIAEVQNYLANIYLLGFGEENKYLDYRIGTTFKYNKPSYDPEAFNSLDDGDRLVIELGEDFKTQHRKISLRFNNEKLIGANSHFPMAPSAWGNITYYSDNGHEKNNVLIHEIQNDYFEKLTEQKNNDKVSEFNIKSILRIPAIFRMLRYDQDSETAFSEFKERIIERRNLLKGDIGYGYSNIETAYTEVKKELNTRLEKFYSDKRKISNILKLTDTNLVTITSNGISNSYTLSEDIKNALPEDHNINSNTSFWERKIEETLKNTEIRQKGKLISQKQADFLALKSFNKIMDKYIFNYKLNRFNLYKKYNAYKSLDNYDQLSFDKFKQLFDNVKNDVELLGKAATNKVYDEKELALIETQKNYFNPIVHNLIQTVIKEKGKDFPIYFSGYEITKLTQGSEASSKIYAGPEEVAKGLVDKIGPLYIAMKKIPGIKLIYEENLPGYTSTVGGYRVDVTDYHYTTPVMFQKEKEGAETVSPTKVDDHIIYMKDLFRKAGVEVTLLSDTSMNEAGKILGVNSEEYQELLANGDVKEGQAAIIINPDKLYSDTVFHEFGHLFIELVGGLKNKKIIEALAQLKGTQYEKILRQRYSNLSDEDFQKELITTALGEEATRLFDNKDKQSWWKRFVLWFKNTINRITGVPTNKVTELANEFLNFGKDNVNSELSENTFFQKDKFEPRIIINNSLKTLEGIRSRSLSAIGYQINNLKNTLTKEDVVKNRKTRKEVKEYEKLQAKLENIDKIEDVQAINAYLVFMDKKLKFIKNFLKSSHDLIHNNKNIINSQTFIKTLNHYKRAVEGFSLAIDIKDSLDQGFFNNNEHLTDELKENMQEMLSKLTGDIGALNKELISASINNLANIIAPYSNKTRVQYEEIYEVEWNKLTDEEKKNETQEEYVNRNINENEDKIEEENLINIKRKLTDSSIDVQSFAAWIQGEKDINNDIVKLLSKIIDDADIQRNKVIIDLKVEFEKAYKELNASNSSGDPKKKFAGYYEEGSDGNLYLTSEYSVEYLLEIKKREREVQEAFEEYSNGTITKKQFNLKKRNLAVWVDKNTDEGGLPIAEWKNTGNNASGSNYNQVKDTLMYQTLITATLVNNKKTAGLKSNVFEYERLTFFKAPLGNKEGYEEVASGQKLQSLWENIQSIYKVRADETEYGNAVVEQSRRKQLYDELDRRYKAGESLEDLKDEINTLNVLTNEVGDLKNQIPLFYRGQHNLKTQSYDLASLLLMDSLMAENFYQKSKIKDTVEMLTMVVDNIRIKPTTDVDDKLLTTAKGGLGLEPLREIANNGSANFSKIMHSIVENRMYGITTIKTQIAPIARSLMKWSAMTMLGLNYTAGVANILQGKIMNFIEGFGNKVFDNKDLRKAEVEFWANLSGSLNDMGRTATTGKTDLLFDLLDINGSTNLLSTKYHEDNRFKALFKSSALFAANTMGEYYINATLMYAILNGIKVKNAENQYIDSNGKVVSKEEAMSLSEAFTTDEGKLVLNKYAKKTSFGTQNLSLDLDKDKAILEVRNYINKIAIDLYGSYDKEIQSMAQRHVWGKMIAMLRKWLVPGMNRRWRGISKSKTPKALLKEEDRHYSEDKQSFDEGMYVSFIRFISNMYRDLKRLGLGQFSSAYRDNMDELTIMEKDNIRKTLIEMGMITLTFIMSLIGMKLLDGADDDDDELLLYYTFFSRRLYNELSFYINPLSTFEILQSPAATVSYIESITRLFAQIIEDSSLILQGEGVERYTRGNMKGQPKVYKRFSKVFPVTSVLNGATIEEKVSYATNLIGN